LFDGGINVIHKKKIDQKIMKIEPGKKHEITCQTWLQRPNLNINGEWKI
jgi:hypothetical protein